MNQEIKAKWLAALRSGEYKQGFNALKRDDCYCVLGVLCDIHRIEHGGEWESEDCVIPWVRYMGNSCHLPAQVAKWAGLIQASPILPQTGEYLMALNDTHEMPFSQLADRIESEL